MTDFTYYALEDAKRKQGVFRPLVEFNLNAFVEKTHTLTSFHQEVRIAVVSRNKLANDGLRRGNPNFQVSTVHFFLALKNASNVASRREVIVDDKLDLSFKGLRFFHILNEVLFQFFIDFLKTGFDFVLPFALNEFHSH